MKNIVLRSAIMIGVVLLAWHIADVPANRSLIRPSEAVAAVAPSTPRVPLTTSHVTGAPEPPPPYITPRIFPKLHFKNPLEMVVAPGSDRWYVVEQAGRIFSFPNRQDCDHADLLLDIPKQIRSLPENGVVGDTYGLVFHPKFAENRFCYTCYQVMGKTGNSQLPNGTRVSRFRVSDTDSPRIDPSSEKIIITWLSGGHNGGSLKFGPDGYLYISSGDGGSPNPPDPYNTGQDISDLLSSILRIDVDHPSGDRPYTIPADNPFVKTPGARGEVWAYGLRNPWRMSFDRQTGDLWVGDVGWELWESIDRVIKGGNYGWSIFEGPQPVYPDHKRGPTPIIPPNLSLPHSEAACIIGGYVYRGNRLKELIGTYICGDWETRRVWGTRFDGDKLISHRELANSGPRIVAFGEDHDGELCILDYDLGTIHELRPNPDSGSKVVFPTKLGETGLFASVSEHRPAAGVVPFSIVAEQWVDHATAERFIALPGLSSVAVHREPIDVEGTMFKGQFMFPKDGLLMKTFWMEMESGNPASRRRLETQLLHFNGREWRGYSYRWNDEQTDATLVAAAGQDRELTVADPKSPGGKRVQTWHYPSRQECIMCHNPWTDYRLAFTLPQLAEHDQLARLEKMAVIKRVVDPPEKSPDPNKPSPAPLANPYDPSADLNRRARSYLQVNCSHCHQFGAGGTAEIDVRIDLPILETKSLDATPKQGMFGIKDARIIVPGDPYRSVMYYRTSKMGHGRMPHIGSELVDAAGVELLHDWIRQMPFGKDGAAAAERVRALEKVAATLGDTGGVPSALQAPARAETIQQLLSSTSGALALLHAMETRPLPPALHDEVVGAAYANSDPQIHDLFEQFVPAEKRVKRLGSVIDAAQLLAVPGDAARGRALFFAGTSAQCKNCHRIDDQGGKLGPELTHIGKKYDRAQLLDNIIFPSKTIDPAFAAWLIQTSNGKSYLGILVEKNAREVILRDVEDKQIHIPAGDVEQMVKQSKSLMPEQLLRDLTAQQAADLLGYLETMK
jgi:putative heme-binding domain-containing protein